MTVERYVPGNLPDDQESIVSFLVEELQKLSQVLDLIIDGEREVLHVIPLKPVEGMVVSADGTDWDPGSGVGIYVYRSSAWVFVG